MRGARRGVTLIELVLAIAVMALAVAVAAGSIGSALPQMTSSIQPITALELARDLMEEVLSKNFNDPDADGETAGGSGSRTALDDMDDYAGYEDGPCVDPEGNLIPGTTDFRRTVAVYAVIGNLGGVTQLDPNRAAARFLKAEVRVFARGALVITITGLKTNTGPPVAPLPRSGIEYEAGTRNNGSGEHVRASFRNRSGRTVVVTSVEVYWTPDQALFFREVQVGGQTLASRTSPYFAEGEVVTLSTPVTFAPNELKAWEFNHFRLNSTGGGGNAAMASRAMVIVLRSGATAVQIDIGTGG